MLNVNFLKKGLGPVPLPYFAHGFSKMIFLIRLTDKISLSDPAIRVL